MNRRRSAGGRACRAARADRLRGRCHPGTLRLFSRDIQGTRGDEIRGRRRERLRPEAALRMTWRDAQILVAIPQQQCDHDFGNRLRYSNSTCSIRRPAPATIDGMSRVRKRPAQARSDADLQDGTAGARNNLATQRLNRARVPQPCHQRRIDAVRVEAHGVTVRSIRRSFRPAGSDSDIPLSECAGLCGKRFSFS